VKRRLDRTRLSMLGREDELIERESELALLERAVQEAQDGSGSVLLVEAPTGLGKSHLLAAGRALATDAGLAVLAAMGRELERDFSFGVALQLFESRLERAELEERAELFAGPAKLAEPLFRHGPRETLPGQAFSLFHGLYWVCSNLTGQGPLMLCVDDANWVDEPSLRFALYLAQRIDELPVVLVLACRPLESGEELLSEIAADPVVQRIRPKPLSAEGVVQRVCSSLFPSADAAFCDACFEVTRGNPFLLRELMAELVADGVAPSRASVERVRELAPRPVAVSLARRLRGVTGAEQLARAVAVLGDEVELRHAGRLAGLEPSNAAPIADALMGLEIFREGEPLNFAHPIMRNACYHSIPPAERGEAHLKAARMLAEGETPAELIAGHLLLARREASGWAVQLLMEAAERALARGAPGSAAHYLHRALEEPPPEESRARVVLALGRAKALAGEPDAVASLTEALELLDDPREQGLAALDSGRALAAQGRHRDATVVFKRGLSQLSSEDHELRARLQAGYAMSARIALPPDEIDREAFPDERALESLPPPARGVVLAHVSLDRALSGGTAEEVRELAREALGRGSLLDEETADGLGYYAAVMALAIAEDLQAAELASAAALEEARSRGSVLGFGTACYFRAFTLLRRGRVDDAAANAQNALASGQRGWRLALAGAHSMLADSLIERGELTQARRELAEAARAIEEGDLPTYLFHTARGRLRLSEGLYAEALEDFRNCGEHLAAMGSGNPAVAEWRLGAAFAHSQLGNPDKALELVEEDLAEARRFGAPGPEGAALRALGWARKGDAGLEALYEAVAVLERSECALELARALVDLGAALRRAGRRKDAAEPLREGLDRAERCGARVLADRARSEVTAAGWRPRRTAVSGLEALTPRERQVAELAAQGMSNREIAEALFVTVKTVEWHLGHSYEKLGVSSRGDLGRALARVPEDAAP